MLTQEANFEAGKMTDRNLAKTSESMKKTVRTNEEIQVKEVTRNTGNAKQVVNRIEKKVIKTGVARKRNEKAG